MPVKNTPILEPTSRRLELSRWLAAWGFLSLVAISAASGQTPPTTRPAPIDGIIPVPNTPAAVLDIVEIHPYRLHESYRHDWQASRPEVSSGLLVVLRVAPEYVSPRDAAEPVLYAGDRTVQRLNQGNSSGYVVGLLPGEFAADTMAIWFGRPELPERVTAEMVAAERALAEEAGIEPFTADQIERAWRDDLDVENLTALLRGPAAELVLKYSPDEKDLADTWRLPTAGSR